jgi:hypothetical protein
MMIYDLAEQENAIVYEFILQNQELVRNTEELIELLVNVAEIRKGDAMAYYFLHGQVKNALSQCLLSILRDHEVQAQLMLRYSIETACLAAYSLHYTRIENFMVNDEIGAKPVQKIKEKAHKWLSQRYPDHSKNLQRLKNNVNEYYAHGNLFAAMLKLDKSTYSYSYFDRDDALIKQSHVWEAGYVAAVIFDLLHQTAKESPVVQIREDTFRQFLLLVRESQGHRAEFLKNKRFTKWSNR